MGLKKKGGLYPALFLFSVFFLSIFQIKSYDLWWHIKAGESIVGARHALPLQLNKFSWTEPNHPWANFSWLFDVIVYSIHNAAGFNGLIIFQAILVAAVFFFVYKTIVLRSENPPQSPFDKGGLSLSPSLGKRGQGRFIIIVALFLIAYLAARFRFSLRPHLFALLFSAIDIYLLNKLSGSGTVPLANTLSHRERVRVRVPLIAIPLIQILWANTHASAILGILLPGIFVIGTLTLHPLPKGEGKRYFHISRLTLYGSLILLTFLASLINPFGIRILMESFIPFFDVGSVLNTLAVDEWQMPGKDMFLGWYGLLLAIGIMSFLWQYIYGRGHLAPTDIFLFLIFALLSIKAVRFIDLFIVAAVPVIYKNLALLTPSPSLPPQRGRVKVGGGLTPFLALSLFWVIGIKDTTFTLGLGIDEEVIPKKAVDFMERNGIQGKVFNSYNFGGYLIYEGYSVFIDGRLCYSPQLVKDFADANFKVAKWERVEQRYKPDIALMEYEKAAIPESLLLGKKNWALVYWDDLSMLFLKRNERFSDIIAKSEYKELNPMDMYGRGGFPSPGGRGLREGGTMNIHPHPDPLPSRERGDILFWEKAIFAEAQRRIKDGPESMRAHLLMGNLYVNSGEPNKAIAEYNAVIDSPLAFGKAEAHNNLGTAYERRGDVYSAEKEYKAAVRLDGSYPLPERNLGYLTLRQSKYIEALWHLERYLQLDKGDRNTWAIVSDSKKYRDTLILRVFIGGMAIIGIMWIAARNLCRGNS